MNEYTDLPQWALLMYRNARKNAERRNKDFSLTLPQFKRLLDRSGGRCAVSGLSFDFSVHAQSYRRPFAPSIDRIRSDRGYFASNCRIVCVIVNLALSDWGMEPFLRVVAAVAPQEETLRQQMESRKWWRSSYMTVAEFCDDNGVVFSKSDQVRFRNRLIRYCNDNMFNYEYEERVVSVRKDGGETFSKFLVFPSIALEKTFEDFIVEGSVGGKIPAS